MVNVILVDQCRIFRQCLIKIWKDEHIADVLADLDKLDELAAVYKSFSSDLLVVNMSTNKEDSVDEIKKFLMEHNQVKCLVLIQFLDAKFCHALIEAGVRGYVLISSGINDLNDAVKRVASGQILFSNEVLKEVAALSKNDKLIRILFTEREKEVIRLICDGLTNQQIAEKMHLSYDTIKWHRSNILEKSHCTNTLSLYKFAIENKLYRHE
ncbi:MAG: response regulator transcription factor [Bacteroidota bacterium]|nr:response regulator transcription factor [Bacteroidota bacterium]MDP4224955.1 response regulator transcription factor [Bacteroidota bacterium]MDP4274572.1 response regulator transcription factor [Bacteroidota bacterium]